MTRMMRRVSTDLLCFYFVTLTRMYLLSFPVKLHISEQYKKICTNQDLIKIIMWLSGIVVGVSFKGKILVMKFSVSALAVGWVAFYLVYRG